MQTRLLWLPTLGELHDLETEFVAVVHVRVERAPIPSFEVLVLRVNRTGFAGGLVT
jgi:hypothetical protein